MKLLYTILLFILMSLIAGAGDNNDANYKEPKIKYKEYVKRIEAGDTTINYFYFRMAYAKSKDYDPTNTNIENYSDKMIEASNLKDFNYTKLMADEILKRNYTHIDAHLATAWAQGKLGNTQEQQFHNTIAQKLLKSIMEMGDGRSTEGAYIVINVHEEYDLLNALGLKSVYQGLIREGKSYFDEVKAVDSGKNDTTVIYFNVNIPYHNRPKNLR